MQTHYYEKDGLLFASAVPRPDLKPSQSRGRREIIFLSDSDPVLGRGIFRANHPGQLLAPDGLSVLDASRLPSVTLDETLGNALDSGRLSVLNWSRKKKKKMPEKLPSWNECARINILAVGDVGSMLMIGLKLLGNGRIERIGICDLSETVTARWEFEMGQVSLPWNYDAFPEVVPVPRDGLFDCDVMVFAATAGILPVRSDAGDVRMAQLEGNARIIRSYAREARKAKFRGLFAVMSDPVDPLAWTVYHESNLDEDGKWDGAGLLPEQVQGFGLGVMNARAAYYAKKDARFAGFLRDGRAYGPHGEGLWIANSISGYREDLSAELTAKTVSANMKLREMGFKPYVAPALSSGALSLLLTIRGEWHYGSVFLDGVYMGCRTRYTASGIETELLPEIPDRLYAHLVSAVETLKEIRR